MKVVGLLSGGKDSCFNLCHCVAQGHEVVALASLGPEGGKEEIDSYLYQTVGQDGLHYIAQALDLPLFRRKIQGTAVDQGSDYASTSQDRQKGHVDGDETEDLYFLLKDVLAKHPDIKGVSVGAILSNYQRVRVEHVCARLNLQALSFLWQYDQSELLEEMGSAGMESVIIKVAGAGLGVKHLGKNVCSEEMRDELELLHGRWGTHPAGEGGEYETFTIDCPLFKKRIKLTQTETAILSSPLSSRDEFGTVAYLRLKAAELVDKEDFSLASLIEKVTVPPLLDPEAEKVLQLTQSIDPAISDIRSQAQPTSFQNRSGAWLHISEITSPSLDIQQEIRGCFMSALDILRQHHLDITSVAHINLYLSTMSLFQKANEVYNSFFGPSPPTRACVSAILPEGTRIKMDFIAHVSKTQNPRTALHVRGLSYWAPANIGPYSQAVMVGERLFIAGQIGLQPSSLSLPTPASLVQESALSTQHVRRIVKAVQEGTGGGFTGWMESCICWVSGPASTFAYKRETDELPKGAQIEWQVTWSTGRKVSEGEDDEDDGYLSPKPSYEKEVGTDFTCKRLAFNGSAVDIQVYTRNLGAMSLKDRCDTFSLRLFHTVPLHDMNIGQGTQFIGTTVHVLNLATAEVDRGTLAIVDMQAS